MAQQESPIETVEVELHADENTFFQLAKKVHEEHDVSPHAIVEALNQTEERIEAITSEENVER